MKVLVTGANGFIGSSLVEILCKEGFDVRAMVQPGTSLELLQGVDLEVVEGDLLDRRSLDAALKGCEQLYHLAAIYAVWHPTPNLLYRVNVEGTVHLMEAAMAAGVKRVVYTSSIAAVGVNPDGSPANEETLFNQWDNANEYVLSKYISELEVHRLIKKGLPCVIVNPAFPFGWGDIGPTPTGTLVLHLIREQFPLYFDGGFNGVDVRDVAMGHYLGMQHGEIGERYLLCGDNITYKDFTRRVCDIAGTKPPRWEIPSRFVVSLGKLNEFVSNHITHKPPLLVEKGIKYTAQKLFFDNRKAREKLGFDPRPLEEAIKDSVRWFRSRGMT